MKGEPEMADDLIDDLMIFDKNDDSLCKAPHNQSYVQ